MDIDEFTFCIKESTVPNAGHGTFAKMPFKKGSLVCEYCGKVYKEDLN